MLLRARKAAVFVSVASALVLGGLLEPLTPARGITLAEILSTRLVAETPDPTPPKPIKVPEKAMHRFVNTSDDKLLVRIAGRIDMKFELPSHGKKDVYLESGPYSIAVRTSNSYIRGHVGTRTFGAHRSYRHVYSLERKSKIQAMFGR